MTPKQKLKSIERKMQKIEDEVPNIQEMLRYLFDIQNYSKLRTEHFTIKWDMEHCDKCGKEL